MVIKFIFATVGSALVVTVANYIFEDSNKIKPVKSFKTRTVIEKIIDPGFTWEGNNYLNWAFIAGLLYFSDYNNTVKGAMLGPQIFQPIFFNEEAPFNSTYILIGTAALWNLDWMVTLAAYSKVFLYDLSEDWFIYSILHQKEDVSQNILAKTVSWNALVAIVLGTMFISRKFFNGFGRIYFTGFVLAAVWIAFYYYNFFSPVWWDN